MQFSDAHNDIWEKSGGNKDVIKFWFDNKIKNSGANKILCAYYSKNNQNDEGIKNMQKCFSVFNKLGDKIVPTVENCWFLTPKNIDAFINLKPFCCTLTHNQTNTLCGGALDSGGFTTFGKEIVKILEKSNIIIDTAHMNRRSFYEFADLTTKPIFNSHCGFCSFFNHKRNLTFDQIKLIVQSKGYVGLAFYSKFFGKDITSDDLSQALIWFLDNFGENTLGFGTDFNGVDEDCLPRDVKNYLQLDNLYDMLLDKQLKNSTISKFFNENLANFVNRFYSW